MDRTIEYAQTLSNFQSAYNATSDVIYKSIIRPSVTSPWTIYGPRPSSPLFHRTASPPPHIPIRTTNEAKFSFDLYKMDESDGIASTTFRPISPLPVTTTVIHHHPLYSPIESPKSSSGPVSKLRQVNDELYQTLIRSENFSPPARQKPSSHYHIHHYPISQATYRTHSPPRHLPVDAPPKTHKARVTYRIHIPQRHRDEQSYRNSPLSRSDRTPPPPVSDESLSDEPIIVDLYPTRDRDVHIEKENHSDQRNPWQVEGKSIRRQSYSDSNPSTTRSHGFYYGDKPISSHRRTKNEKERQPSGLRHPAPFVTSRPRPDTAPAYQSDPFRESTVTFSHREPARHSNRPAKTSKPVVDETPRNGTHNKHILAFDSPDNPSPRPKAKRQTEGTDSEPTSQRRPTSDRATIRHDDPKMKRRVVNAESKVKSAWEPAVNTMAPGPKGAKQPPANRRRPSTTPRSPQVTDRQSPTGTHSDRSSLHNVPRQPIFESTPTNQSNVTNNDESSAKVFESESEVSDQTKKAKVPTPPPPPVQKNPTPPPAPPRVEKSPTPPPAQVETTTEHHEPSAEETKPTVKHDATTGNNDAENSHFGDQTPTPLDPTDQNEQPTPPPEEKTPPVKPKSDADESEEEEDENDQEVAGSFDFSKWLRGASEAIRNGPKQTEEVLPSTPRAPPPKVSTKVSPRPKEKPSSPTPSSPDDNLYKPPFGPKKGTKPTSPPPAPVASTTTADGTPEVDDFFS